MRISRHDFFFLPWGLLVPRLQEQGWESCICLRMNEGGAMSRFNMPASFKAVTRLILLNFELEHTFSFYFPVDKLGGTQKPLSPHVCGFRG